MTNTKKAAVAGLFLAASLSTPGYAQMFQGGWYADVEVGQGRAKGYETTSNRETTWGARVGARLSPNFAVDVGYWDLGKFDLSGAAGYGPSGSTIKATSWGLSLVAIAPIDAFDVYGRIGYARTETKLDVSIPGVATLSGKNTENEAFYGVGGRYNFGNWNVFLEWNKWDKTKWDNYNVGVGLRF
jgi:Outer membrane protein beta-barrel domain